MELSRREFGTIVGAGLLFPRKLLGFERRRPEGHYPLYYMEARDPFFEGFSSDDKVYQLWQPGIIIGIAGGLSAGVMVYSPEKSGRPSGFKDDLYNAILTAPAHSLLVDDCYGRPYRACGDFWCHNEYGPRPVVLRLNNTETLAAYGHLRRCKPFCTLDDWLKLKEIRND